MKDEARVMSRMALPEETQVERQLRPQRLDEYVGQRAAVESLRVSVEAARQRREPLDHVLLSGPPGLGKTTLATIMANEMGAAIVTTAGPSLERGGDLMGILTNLSERDVLFIDEIHRLPRVVDELLYPAVDDLSSIIRRSASRLEVAIEPAGAEAIARRSRGTPRIANRLLRRVRDYCQVRGDGVITAPAAGDSLDREGVDVAGLDRLDRRFLMAIIEQYGGGPVGLEAIAATINDEAETLVEVVEPFLLKIGYIVRSPNGRRATPAAYAHLEQKLPVGPGGQTQLPL